MGRAKQAGSSSASRLCFESGSSTGQPKRTARYGAVRYLGAEPLATQTCTEVAAAVAAREAGAEALALVVEVRCA